MLSVVAVVTVVVVQLLVAGRGGCQDVGSSLEAVVERQGALLDQLQAQIARLSERVAIQEAEIAFNARFSQPHGVPTPSGNQSHVLVFDHTDLNLGRGYDPTTGIFVVPVSGLYLFNLKIAHAPPGNMHVQIVRDGVGAAEVEASGSDGYMDRSTTDLVLRLSTGQKVWTEWVSGSSTRVEGSLRPSFMGVLLKGE